MNLSYLSEIAGLLTSLFFALNAVVITRAGGQVGSVIANRTRVLFALIYLIVLNVILFHQPLPFYAGTSRWFWLALSGVIGLAIGDAFLFQAYLSIGPRLGMLLLSLSTIFGALEAWLFFGESLRFGQIAGILLALAGIIWVLLEQSPGNPQKILPSFAGISFGILAALGQATGLVFSKQGMLGDFSPISGNAIRMLAAAIALWFIAAFQKQAGKTIATLRANPSALKLLALAAFIGPVAGVSLSLFAVQNIAVGVASVLTSLSPIFMLPFSRLILKETIGWQAIAGTLLATIGVVILFLT
jgi:drug/metabolite transporter (DMT)-like permease